MIKLIIGVKGTGKTKQLIDQVNAALDSSKGDVVCIEKGDKLKFDVKYQCRLIDTDYFDISGADSLYGFIAGILASNHDVTDLYIDSALKICEDKVEDFDVLLDKVNGLVEKAGVKCVITASIAVESATAAMKKYI